MNEAVSHSLERVLRSTLFAKAERQSRFLRHIVEKHLAGDDASLRETSIGLEVYGRPATYDPKTDPIVRVEASRLRSRLREYYENEGALDSIRIDIPKGSYVPTFESRTAAAAAPETPPPVEPVVVEPRPTHRLLWVFAGLLLATAGMGAFWYRSPQRLKPIDSLAVLPFSDLSEKSNLGYVSEGLTEQIQDELGRIRDLRVVGSTTAGQIATNPDKRAASKQVGVDALLEGSVRAEGEKIRVAVRLIDGATGSRIWTGSFDGERSSLFELEERIAQGVAGKLSIQLDVRREGVDAQKAPQRAQAHEYYQQARALAEHDSAAPGDEIYRLYQLAVTTDPSYAPPHAGLSTAMVQRGDSKSKALEEARRAIALDPRLPAGYSALIFYYRDADMDWKKGRAACADSLQKFPNAVPILATCGSIEGLAMNHAKEIEFIRRAVAIDPLSSRMHGGLMFSLYQAGQFGEALSESDLAIRLGTKSNFLFRHRALILAAMGKPAEGLQVIEEAERNLGGVPEDWLPVRGYLLGRLQRRTEAEQLIRDYAARGALPLHLCIVRLGLGDRAQALDWFERSYAEDPSLTAHAIPEYYMRELDGEPRFEAIKNKLVGQTLPSAHPPRQ